MGDSIRILILEDVPLDVELMEAELKRDGINFISRRVEEENEYRRELKKFQPDVILADHSLPHFDGISAMNISQEVSPQTPFIFVSGQMGEEFAVEMLKKGATDYVLKHNLSKLGHSVKRALNEAEEYLEKKRAQDELAKSEEKYKTLFDLSLDYVVVLDLDGKVQDINQRLEEDSGFLKDDFIGKDINNVFKSMMNDSVFDEDFMHGFLAGDKTTPIEIKVDRDRGIRYFELHHAPIMKEGKVFAIQLIFRNITRRKNDERALIESRERLYDVNTYLETIINASPFAIVDLCPDGRVKSLWNPAAENIFGWGKDEVLSETLPFINENNVEKCQKAINSALLGESKSDVELECARKDNKIIYTMMATAPLLNVEGDIQGIMATFADINDMIAAENLIKASLDEKEVLLREIHHRVKNNLQIISSLMSLQSEYTQEPEILKMFQESKNRIRSMALIHEKLYQSKDLAHIDFAEYLKSLVAMLLGFYHEKSNDINVILDCEEVNLEIDTAISMGLIVNELLSNCFKHAFPGKKSGEVIINLSEDGENYLLVVSDNGVGIPEDVDIRSTDSLGLQIVQTLTIQLKGNLEHETKGGTTFRIAFPDRS
ncbi:histidine kinase dimerization/phosphoacceptor domain -containing protein [Methanobacterium petrolearium]|uniref:histidine kinase dimerization/phosphoacceptor domain -containing protein n=1 Tax=Methanobacterium petrolearium TaxID=710190 RepID=UPI001AE253BC|nr:histidine kinase dimerization/phosphoacceptor domain -containing protein [Methanobacterium petrolearium]MBP1946753.1 PAS domain S-box-containing protein [Methanobacterium petrolearium]BDZ69725.1 histidine kinase [Methanobacterium petrolearium]